MRILKTGLTTLGLAAAIGAPTMGFAADEDLTTTWSGATKHKGGNKVEVKIDCKLTAGFFHHDVDDAWYEDEVARAWADIYDDLGTPGNAEDLADWQDALSTAWYGANADWADGVKLNDAEIRVRVKAWNHFVAGIRYNGAKDAVSLDNWYFGVSGLPVLGEVTIREVNNGNRVLGSIFQRENSMADEAFELNDLVGIQITNSKAFGALPGGFFLAAGMDSGEAGVTDENWEVQGGIWIEPVINEAANVALHLGLDFEVQNPSSDDHQDDETLEIEAGVDWGQDVVVIDGSADEALLLHFKACLTAGPFALSSHVHYADVTATDGIPVGQQVLQDFLLNGPSSTVDVERTNDWSAMGLTVEAACSLTGENQQIGGGMSGPKKPLDIKGGSGFGGLEAVARFSMVNIQDDVANSEVYLNPAFGLSTADLISQANRSAQQREEGGKATQINVGLNWYPVKALRIGLFYNICSWEYDSGALTGLADLAQAVDPLDLTAPPSMADIMLYSQGSSVRNDYTVQSIYLTGQAKF